MEKPSLKNKNEYPNDEVLSSHLGEVKKIWDSFIAFLKDDHPLFSTEWRYYNDGKNWLFKVTKKKKTICWVSIWDNMFKTTFYFTPRVEDLLKNSNLTKQLIDQFIHGKSYGKIKGLTVKISSSADLEMTKILIDIKEKLK
ncbi:MAG: DUF3788 family protein [Candidatus Cloacimonetes bacterium]|jgi:hypothetical protein|nr:DUF3788 family protein [Candidatus Cloacimonadota bacterium]